MKYKYDYFPGFCEVSNYRGLYPIKFIQEIEKGPFVKIEMVCNEIEKGKCNKSKTCPIFLDANSPVPEKDIWKLKDSKIGE